MNIQIIKKEILTLSKMHEAIDEITIGDLKDAELMENEIEKLIISYCQHQRYLINGKIIDDKQYISREYLQWCIEKLAIEKEDIAEIWWYYNKNFWPDWVGEKTDFINQMKERLENKFYDFEL